MGLKMKNFNIMGVHRKIQFLGEVTEIQCRGGNCLKRGHGQFAGLRGDLAKKRKRGWMFLRRDGFNNFLHSSTTFLI